MIETKKVFITVKTYPTLSKKYDELVCTAGFFEDGSWVRIYPFPFRKLDYDKQKNWGRTTVYVDYSMDKQERYSTSGMIEEQIEWH